MKTYEDLTLRMVLGDAVIVNENRQHAGFDKIVSLNKSAAMLWESVAGRDFTTADLASLLTEHYGIDSGRAMEDAEYIAEKWIQTGMVQP